VSQVLGPEPPEQQQTPKRVLVVEDEPDFAALMESMLRGLGYDVSIAYDGDEALSEVQAAAPDVITLDIQMPKQSGVFFYRKMKSQEALRNIPVIVVTGLRRDDPEWDGIIRTFLDVDHLPHPEAYLDKPVDRDRLAKVMSGVLAQRLTT
jgi:two-component system phosphate regulon response regulator PhoB